MVFHYAPTIFSIIVFYIGFLGCRCGNGSDACVSVGFSRATSERPHREVIATRHDDSSPTAGVQVASSYRVILTYLIS